MPVRSRLAPTPSGFLHIGNALNFILTWLMVRQHGGKLLLRIDDLDAERKRPEYVDDVFESLEWLGLEYDEGPSGPEDFERNWSQHHRLHLYEELLERLQPQTELLYGSTLSRKQLAQASSADELRQLLRQSAVSLGTPEAAWRIAVPEDTIVEIPEGSQKRLINLSDTMPDFVVRQKNSLPAYQIASLADDVHFGITHIVRGEDLIASTAAQIWLATLLRKADFLKTKFYHHPILQDETGQKLSKSAGVPSLKAMREAGVSSSAVYCFAGHWVGIEHQVESLKQLLESSYIRFEQYFQ